jgi:hypothetical protein
VDGVGRYPWVDTHCRIVLSLLVFLSACGGISKSGDAPTSLTVTPTADGKPHSLSAGTAVVPDSLLGAAVQRSGAGLRTGGDRKGILVRYGVLDSAAEEFLLEALDVGEAAFSPRAGLAFGDEVEVRTSSRNADRGRYSLHLQPRGSDPRIDRLEMGIVARPVDGSLLPVIRAGIPVDGSGTYLITCEAGAGEAFVAFLRIEIAGAPRAGISRADGNHRLTTRSFTVKTRDLSRILRLEDIEERGGPGGFVVSTLGADRIETLAKALLDDGVPGPTAGRVLGQSATTTVRAGGLNLAVTSTFRPSTTRYTTVVTVQNREDVPPLFVVHGDREAILLLGWDAESPGTSTAALIELTPID